MKHKPRRGDRNHRRGNPVASPGLVHRVHQAHGSRRGLLSAAPPVLEANGFAASRQSAAFLFQMAAFCRKPLRRFLQSQRDCVLQPRVARHELPWVVAGKIFNPNGVAPQFHREPQPRWGCGSLTKFPRVAPSSQPWALSRNPVGIHNFSRPPSLSNPILFAPSAKRSHPRSGVSAAAGW